MTDNIPLDAVTTQTVLPLGETLAEARTAKNLSQQDISNYLRFSVKQVNALENDQFDALPDAMITRGFIRNYARYLGLDAEPLLQAYKSRVPTKSTGAVSVQSSMYQVMSGKDSQPWLMYILGSILVLLFLLAWFFYIDYMPKNSKPVANQTPEAIAPNAPTEVPLPEIALPAAEREPGLEALPATDPAAGITGSEVAPTTPGAVVPESAAPLTPAAPASSVPVNPALPEAAQKPAANALAPVPANTNSTNTNPAAAATPQTISPATQAANAVSPGAKTITLSVTEKTWVNVTNKAGKVVYERILPPGGADAIDAEPPLNVVVGNAKATTLSYKGQPVNLASSMTGSNVARIKLE